MGKPGFPTPLPEGRVWEDYALSGNNPRAVQPHGQPGRIEAKPHFSTLPPERKRRKGEALAGAGAAVLIIRPK